MLLQCCISILLLLGLNIERLTYMIFALARLTKRNETIYMRGKVCLCVSVGVKERKGREGIR